MSFSFFLPNPVLAGITASLTKYCFERKLNVCMSVIAGTYLFAITQSGFKLFLFLFFGSAVHLCILETDLNCIVSGSRTDLFGSVWLENLIASMEIIREDI